MLQNQLQSGPTAYKVINKTNHIDPMHIKLTNQTQCTLTNQLGFRQTTYKAKKDTNRDHVQSKLLPITMNDYKTHGPKPKSRQTLTFFYTQIAVNFYIKNETKQTTLTKTPKSTTLN
jgi:hypothetical protein